VSACNENALKEMFLFLILKPPQNIFEEASLFSLKEIIN